MTPPPVERPHMLLSPLRPQMDSRFTPDHIAWHESAHPLFYSFYPQGNPTVPLAALYFCPIKETQISVNHSSFPQGLQNWLCRHFPWPNHCPPSLHRLSSHNNQVPSSHSPESWRQIIRIKWPQLFHSHPPTPCSLLPFSLRPKTCYPKSVFSWCLVPNFAYFPENLFLVPTNHVPLIASP